MKIGVVVGRFQTYELHQAHRDLLQYAWQQNRRLVIFIGVSPVDGHTAENPLSYSQRHTLMTSSSVAGGTNTLVFPLFDKPTDEAWSAQLDSVLAMLFPNDDITLYCGRDSFFTHYKGKHGVEIWTSKLLDNATTLRKSVPEESATLFMKGQIYALNKQYPHAYPTVDIAVMKDDDVLIIQRADTKEWGLPGGFVDPTDETLEKAAARELLEETGLSCEAKPNYVGSIKVRDWRYRSSRDGIITSLFAVPYSFGQIRLNSEECLASAWYNLRNVTQGNISPAHTPLIAMLVQAAEIRARKKGLLNV